MFPMSRFLFLTDPTLASPHCSSTVAFSSPFYPATCYKIDYDIPKILLKGSLGGSKWQKRDSVTSMTGQKQDHKGKNRKHRRKTSQCILFFSRKQEEKSDRTH